MSLDPIAWQGCRLLVLDLETTGLPERTKTKKGYHPYEQSDKYDSSRIVQIAWGLTPPVDPTVEYNNIPINCEIIKPSGYDSMPYEAFKIHSISYAHAQTQGKSFKDVVSGGLAQSIIMCDFLVGHNILFDLHILLSELYRLGTETLLLSRLELMINRKRYICSAAWGRYKLGRNISLSALYKHWTRKRLYNAHTADGDVNAVIELLPFMLSKPPIVPL